MRPAVLYLDFIMHPARSLVQSDDDHALVTGKQHDDDSSHRSTLDLRILSIFVILAAGLAGAIPPLFLKVFRDPNSPPRLLLRAMAAGVILALALIHIIPEGVDQLGEVAGKLDRPYPDVGGAVVAGGIVLMITLEAVTHALLSRHLSRAAAATAAGDEQAQAEAAASGKEVSFPEADKLSAQIPSPHVPSIHLCHHHHHYSPAAASQPGPSGSSHREGVTATGADALPIVAAASLTSIRLHVMAYMFELGCIFHSVIIGLALGVATEGRASVAATLATLSAHQLLEGAALSSFVIDASVGMWKGVFMIVVYALTCPVGVAIGVGVASTYDEESVTAMSVQGTFNCLSGAMLLYIGLVQMVAIDFTHIAIVARAQPTWVRVASHACLAFGVAAMALVALGE